jgi:hypothetical protein
MIGRWKLPGCGLWQMRPHFVYDRKKMIVALPRAPVEQLAAALAPLPLVVRIDCLDPGTHLPGVRSDCSAVWPPLHAV